MHFTSFFIHTLAYSCNLLGASQLTAVPLHSTAGLLLLDRGDKTAVINLEAVFTVVMRQQPLGRIHNGLGGVATRELPKEDVLRHDVLQT